MQNIERVIQESRSPIYIVSCGEGFNGEQLVQSVLVQFPNHHVPVIRVPHIRKQNQIRDVVEIAENNDGIIIHTLVDPAMRKEIEERGKLHGVETTDILGNILEIVSTRLQAVPLCKPGLYRQVNKVDLDQVRAIEFSIAHDDGINSDKLDEAEIILVGVSRAGKTPLSIYLSVLGWKVANIPLVPGIPLPEEVLKLDRRRVIALSINPEQLMIHRNLRQKRMGKATIDNYSTEDHVLEEVRDARKIYRQAGFSVIDVSNKPIETSADEIIDIITRRFKENAHIRKRSR